MSVPDDKSTTDPEGRQMPRFGYPAQELAWQSLERMNRQFVHLMLRWAAEMPFGMMTAMSAPWLNNFGAKGWAQPRAATPPATTSQPATAPEVAQASAPPVAVVSLAPVVEAPAIETRAVETQAAEIQAVAAAGNQVATAHVAVTEIPNSNDPIIRSDAMQALTAGITRAGTGVEGMVWNILGQTYVPKAVSDGTFAWHATFPPGTFVPPHIHPTQDEFIYLFEGRLDLVLDGKDFAANPGDFIKLPMGVPHGIFNKSDQTVKCFFWVTPTRKLYDLFWAIHSMKEQRPDEVVALAAQHEVMFLPPPPSA